MPARNSIKDDVSDSYYHIYSRGINKADVFTDEKDYVVFLSLLKRYLSIEPDKNENGTPYPHLYGKLELLCFCLLPNHFHLLIYQVEEGSMQQLMRSVMTSYSMYFNKTYKRSGPLFEGRYRGSHIISDQYLLHISRYIHLNPADWRSYSFSSLANYRNEQNAEWLKPAKILDLFTSRDAYLGFLSDYEDYKLSLQQVKLELANN